MDWDLEIEPRVPNRDTRRGQMFRIHRHPGRVVGLEEVIVEVAQPVILVQIWEGEIVMIREMILKQHILAQDSVEHAGASPMSMHDRENRKGAGLQVAIKAIKL